jgi:uroporphyrinogen-III decarboxylase
MSVISRLIKEYLEVANGAENVRRLSLWEKGDSGLRGETQWHGCPNYAVDSGRSMPVTAECLEKVWEKVLGMDIRRFYTDPDYFLEYFLKYKLLKFRRFADDTPLTPEIPVCFGVTHEAGILGQKVHFLPGEEPQFGKEPIVDEDSILPKSIDFSKNDYLAMAIPYYQRVKSLAGSELKVIFPQWYRGPQGVALYIRGFQEFSVDMYVNEGFAHRVLRYVTDAAKQYAFWRADYTGEPVARCDLFNDDIPLMSPDNYERFFLPYERELSDFHGGVWYWHSCGDITKHVPGIQRLPGVHILDFGVTMENKAEGLKGLGEKPTRGGPRAIEFRVMAKRHVQDASEEEQKEYVRGILAACRTYGIDRYVIRSSGMSLLLGGEPDIERLARWVRLVRGVQSEEGVA